MDIKKYMWPGSWVAAGVNAAVYKSLQSNGIIQDYISRLQQTYIDGEGVSNSRAIPNRHFDLREYTSGVSLFQIRSSRYYSVEEATARAYHSLIGSNVLGGAGLQLETPDDVVNDAFMMWAKNIDSTGVNDWAAHQYEGLLHATRDGECIAQPIVADGELRFSLLDVTNCARGFTDKKRRIYDGIEYDVNYKPVAFYFRKDTNNQQLSYYPTFQPTDYQRIEASRLIRVFWREFNGQTHGIPWMIAVTRHMDLLSRFQQLVLERAKNTTALNGYFERDPRDFDGLPDVGMTTLSPDSWAVVPKGSSFRTVNANFPEGAYDKFTEAEYRRIAMGGKIGYFSLTQDLRSANYSSIRHGKQQEERIWSEISHRFASSFLDKIYQMWLDHYSVMAPTRELRRRISARPPAYWVGPSNPFIDPAKEQTWQTGQLANRTMSVSQLIRSQGNSPRRVLEQIAEDINTMKAMGIPLPAVYQEGASMPVTEPQGEQDEED